MKKSGIFRVSLALVLAAAAFFPEAVLGWLASGQPAPHFSLEDVTGAAHDLSDMKDRPGVVLYFFDMESASNREGLRDFNELARQNDGTGMVFWAITVASRDMAMDFVTLSKLDVPVLLDNSGVSSAYEAVRVLPITYFIRPGLTIISSFQGGGKTSEVQMREGVENSKTMASQKAQAQLDEGEEPEQEPAPDSLPPPSGRSPRRPTPPASTRTPSREGPDEMARKLFELAYRENRKLKWNDCLAGKALERATELSKKGYFEHKDPKTRRNPAWKLISSCGKVSYGGENLAKSQGEGASTIHRALMQSSSHRENILNSKYNLLGVGCYKAICVELFAGS
jgi:uncharacterized protein YkwD